MTTPDTSKAKPERDTSGAKQGAAEKKRGRPKKFVDLELVEKLAHIQCTYAEIAATLDVSVDTLQRNKDFAATYKKGAEGGRKSLRRMQFESANRGNVVMQIWLGKQYLNQSDHGVIQVQRIPSLQDVTSEDLRALLDESLRQYPALAAELERDGTYSVVKPQSPKALPRPQGD